MLLSKGSLLLASLGNLSKKKRIKERYDLCCCVCVDAPWNLLAHRAALYVCNKKTEKGGIEKEKET